MTIIIIALLLTFCGLLARKKDKAYKARKEAAEEQRNKNEEFQEAVNRFYAERQQRIEDRQRIAQMEHEQKVLWQEQMRQAKEQEKLVKEQEKYEIRLAKVEAEQRKMRFEIDQINEDLPLLHRQLDGFMEQMNEWQSKLHKAQTDLEWDELRMREAPSAVKEKEHDAHMKARATAEAKIISLEKNIRRAEKQIATAEFKKSEYTRKLSA